MDDSNKKNILVSIPIIRKGFSKTNSARFKGVLSFVSNKYGVIYDWRINFSHIDIDVYTTASWFNDDNLKKPVQNFNRREELFRRLQLSQIKRPNKTSNNLITLDLNQLEIVNDYFNDRKNGYSSTIKNIIGVLKGNNPGGEAKRPSSAELVVDTSLNIKNFVILLDDLTSKKRVDFDSVVIGAEEKTLEEFTKLNSTIESAFKFMQREKDYASWSSYLVGIKQYYRQYNVDLNVADKIARKARARYGKNVSTVSPLPFGFTSSKQFQKSHIYEFYALREEIVEAIREKKSTEKYEKMISDADNFLPLPEEVHRQFDRHIFTYTSDGKIYPIVEEGVDYINNHLDEKFKSIPNFFLSKKRVEYLKKRNESIIF